MSFYINRMKLVTETSVILAGRPEGVTSKEISDSLDISRGRASQILRDLVDAGLIAASDRTRKMTDQGRPSIIYVARA
jgi:predicted transcriptional regulator